MLKRFLLKEWIKYITEDKQLVNIKISDIGFHFSLHKDNTQKWTSEQYTLKKEVSECKYNPVGNKYPTITKNNILLDGHHRVYCLLKYYDNNEEIVVYKSNYSFCHIRWLVLFSLLLYGKKIDKLLVEDIKKQGIDV